MPRRFIALVTLLAGAAIANAGPKDDVQTAAQKLSDASSYSWASTVEGGFGGNNSGQTEKDGYTVVSMTMRDNTVDAVIKGEKAVVKTEDGWKLASDLANEEGPTRFLAFAFQNYRTPALTAKDLVAEIPEFQKADDAYTADLSPEAAKKNLMRRRRPNANGDDSNGPQVANAKGSVKVWITDGAISKVQLHVSGTVSFNGNDRDVDRTTTTEIKDLNKTTVTVPPEAKAKMDAPPATQPK